jgi:hypothetical protein
LRRNTDPPSFSLSKRGLLDNEGTGNAFPTLPFFFVLFLPAFYSPLSSMFVTTAPYTQPSHLLLLLLLLLSIYTGRFWGGWLLLPLLMNLMKRPKSSSLLAFIQCHERTIRRGKGRVTQPRRRRRGGRHIVFEISDEGKSIA